mmetsp:Transcript_8459/g.18423  ORF Transcript_8459/g.18423 Transcript_8459/m.18423 type:complete len:88 (-) Transcript_8459:2-265(-)
MAAREGRKLGWVEKSCRPQSKSKKQRGWSKEVQEDFQKRSMIVSLPNPDEGKVPAAFQKQASGRKVIRRKRGVMRSLETPQNDEREP